MRLFLCLGLFVLFVFTAASLNSQHAMLGDTIFVQYALKGESSYGLLRAGSIKPIKGSIYHNWQEDPYQIVYPGAVTWLPSASGGKILALSGNQRRSDGRERPFEPFFKSPTSAVGHLQPIVIPHELEALKAEAELVAVIGKTAKNVPLDRAASYILGFTAGLDVGVAEWQKTDKQWWRAKGADTFAPVGPAVVTDLELDNIEISLLVNKKLRDNYRARQYFYDPLQAVSKISRYITLHPGDLIFLGTAGIHTPISAGDTVSVEINGIGTLTNPVIRETELGEIEAEEQRLHRFLFVAGERSEGAVKVYDIDNDFRPVQEIHYGNGDAKGIAACPETGHLYLSAHWKDEVIAYDLNRNEVSWRKAFPDQYVDRLAVHPDGTVLLVPLRLGGGWVVLDARSGEELKRISIPGKPHNTLFSPTGKRAYLSALENPVLYQIDGQTFEIIRKIGPFTDGLRPFTIDAHEQKAYVNTQGRLGFEIGWIEATAPPTKVDVRGFETPVESYHRTPSHGLAISPNDKELWVVNASGYLHVFDLQTDPPQQIADIGVNGDPGWLTFSLDGKYVFCATGDIIDVGRRQIVAQVRPSEKMLEVHFQAGKVVAVGNQIGFGRR